MARVEYYRNKDVKDIVSLSFVLQHIHKNNLSVELSDNV